MSCGAKHSSGAKAARYRMYLSCGPNIDIATVVADRKLIIRTYKHKFHESSDKIDNCNHIDRSTSLELLLAFPQYEIICTPTCTLPAKNSTF